MAAQAVHVHVPLPWDTMRLCDGRTQTALGPRGRSWHARQGQPTAKQKRRFNPVASASRSRQWREQLAGEGADTWGTGYTRVRNGDRPCTQQCSPRTPTLGPNQRNAKTISNDIRSSEPKAITKHFKRIRIAPEPRPDPIGSETLGPQAVRRRMHVYVGNGSSD